MSQPGNPEFDCPAGKFEYGGFCFTNVGVLGSVFSFGVHPPPGIFSSITSSKMAAAVLEQIA